MSEVELGAIQKLATDGGDVSPKEIAEDGGFHIDSVYRGLRRIDDLVEREYGSVAFKSTFVGELLHDAIKQAEDSVRNAVEASAKALDAAERGLDDRETVLLAWQEKYDVNFNERDDGVEIRFGQIDADSRKEAIRRVKRLLRQGYDLWTDINNDPTTIRMGRFRATLNYTKDYLRSLLANEVTKRYTGQIWKHLNFR